jgi:hypothetical protein
MLPPDGEIPPAIATSKLDLLLMVDNSMHTLEKQRYLADGVKWLLDPAGAGLDATDIHVAVITSSLGAHGAQGAKDVCVAAEDNDRAHLLGTLRSGVSTFQNSGFLAWGPAQPDRAQLLAQVEPLIESAGEHGCGYEASLEAWYRFLIEPEPYEQVIVEGGSSTVTQLGVDEELLAQRAAFLRPDSVLAIVMMSDENDCSIQDQGYGWLLTRAAPMYRSTSACANPNDPCCQSCGEAQAKEGCPQIAADAECAKGATFTDTAEDSLNLRCWDQKRRFGFDLLYPITRYTEGLTRQRVFDRDGQVKVNPIFAGDGARRHPSQVIFTGIVGVPWQDVADDASLSNGKLTNLTAAELAKAGRWQLMLGDPTASPPVLPTDPFMVETTAERWNLPGVSGQHPLTGFVVAPSDSPTPQATPINGHEAVESGSVLQTACIFPLVEPKVCDDAALQSNMGCLCFAEDLARNNAACQPPAGGAAGIIQHATDAYPGLRHLQLMKSLGERAVVGSVCPKVLTLDTFAEDYGYRPVMRGLAERINTALEP